MPVDLLKDAGKKSASHLSIGHAGKLVAVAGTEYPPPIEGLDVIRSLQQKGWVGLYDAGRRRFRWLQETGMDFPYPTAVSPDGRFVAAFHRGPQEAGGDKSIFLRRSSDGEMVWVFPIDDVNFSSLAFTRDNRRLIGGTNRGDAIVWDLSMLGGLP